MNNIFRKQHKNYFKSGIQAIYDYVNHLEKENEKLRDKLATFNKDDEIQKHKEATTHNLNHSLLQLSDLENERIKAFKQKHYKECGNGGDYEYKLVGTGIGTVITVKCPKCMSAENVTDSSSW